ncbi:hypothetical protein CEXT_212921 [Caerostris extrusa]|uniref:Uncharacterized protein n=1 Tax=Caerostris extrusa TaxID=172846 RepID=A0AAV4UE27_CAEEX|nr:hypothetical protein CEXT_212921 [Caerostris extrusa]
MKPNSELFTNDLDILDYSDILNTTLEGSSTLFYYIHVSLSKSTILLISELQPLMLFPQSTSETIFLRVTRSSSTATLEPYKLFKFQVL